MKKFSIILLSLLSITYNLLPKKLGDAVEGDYLKELSGRIWELLQDNTEQKVLLKLFEVNCLKELLKIVGGDLTVVFDIINASGKGVSQLGVEEDCTGNYTFNFIQLTVNRPVFFYGGESESLYDFLEQDSFFLGLCFFDKCSNFTNSFLNKTTNAKFFKYLNATYGVTDLVITPRPYVPPGFNWYRGIVWLLITLLLLKIVISLLGLWIFRKEDELDNIRRESKFSYETDSDENEDSKDVIDRMQQKIFETKPARTFSINTSEKLRTKNRLKITFYRIFKFCSYKKSMKYLLTVKNKYFNETGLELITFLRVITIFFATYNQNIYALIRIPNGDIATSRFYTSFWLGIVKFSIFSTDCWILLDGILFSYKLMGYIKKNSSQERSDKPFSLFFKFYLNCISRIIIFNVIFFLLHIYFQYMECMLEYSHLSKYFEENLIFNRDCYEHPWKIFVPFLIQYDMEFLEFSNCYKIANIYANEIICLTAFMLIFYVAYRLKSKYFDWSIGIFIIINIICQFTMIFYIPTNYNVGDYVTFSWFLGNPYNIRLTHNFLNIYALGVFTGLIYFYYYDIVSNNPLESEQNYIPFHFNFSIMKYIDRKSRRVKRVWFIISILLQILISWCFYIYIYAFSNYTSSSPHDGEKLDIKINYFMSFMACYERTLFVLAFTLMMISILVYPKSTTLKYFISSNVFLPFARISFCYMVCLDAVVYLFFSQYNLQLLINYQNIFFMTLGMTFIVSWVSYFFFIVLELPLKMIIKKITWKISHNIKKNN
jgi:hypothetical protein